MTLDTPPLLDRLLAAAADPRGDGWLLPEALARGLGVDAPAVARGLEQLRSEGSELEEHPRLGVRLVASGAGSWRDYLAWKLGGGPRVIEVYHRTASTQDVARRVLESRRLAGDACVAVAQEQTAGRGRRGRRWIAPPGAAVTVSRGLAAATPFSPERLTLASAVAAAHAAEDLLAPRGGVRIKWPNDVLVEGKKLAGVLVETFVVPPDGAGRPGFHAAVIGVGLNVSLTPDQIPQDDPALRARVTSLHMLGRAVDRLHALAAVVSRLDAALQLDDASLMDAWRARSIHLAQAIRLQHDGRLIVGHVVDLDPREGLVVRTDSGTLLHLPSATTSVVDG